MGEFQGYTIPEKLPEVEAHGAVVALSPTYEHGAIGGEAGSIRPADDETGAVSVETVYGGTGFHAMYNDHAGMNGELTIQPDRVMSADERHQLLAKVVLNAIEARAGSEQTYRNETS